MIISKKSQDYPSFLHSSCDHLQYIKDGTTVCHRLTFLFFFLIHLAKLWKSPLIVWITVFLYLWPSGRKLDATMSASLSSSQFQKKKTLLDEHKVNLFAHSNWPFLLNLWSSSEPNWSNLWNSVNGYCQISFLLSFFFLSAALAQFKRWSNELSFSNVKHSTKIE